MKTSLSSLLCRSTLLLLSLAAVSSTVAAYDDVEMAKEYLKSGLSRSAERAVELLKFHAGAGNVEAQLLLGKCYLEGTGTEKDIPAAAESIEKAAQAGNVEAMYLAGNIYHDALLGTADYDKSADYYRRAATAGYPPALTALGKSMYYGDGFATNHKGAVEWYAKASAAGDFEGKYLFALCYAKGDGITKDVDLAMRLIKEAADAGYPRAMRMTADNYILGRSLPQSLGNAREYYLKADRAGDPEASFILGVDWYYGGKIAGRKDCSRALQYLTRVADTLGSQPPFEITLEQMEVMIVTLGILGEIYDGRCDLRADPAKAAEIREILPRYGTLRAETLRRAFPYLALPTGK